MPTPPKAGPRIAAKGLQVDRSERPLIYSAPELGEDGPSIKKVDSAADGTAAAKPKPGATPRSNPNRGSRGNRPGGARGGNRSRKK